jgi:hypothetical protein
MTETTHRRLQPGDAPVPLFPEPSTAVDEAWPERGGHDAMCAYASGISTRCTCSPSANEEN